MKVVLLQGSPRKKGNTASLAESLLKGMMNDPELKVERIFLHDMKILPCRGCNKCHKVLEPACVIKDDMSEIYPKILDADILIMASPVYWWNISAQLKLAIDRMNALLYGEDYTNFKGKKIVLVATYEGEDPNSGPRHIESIFRDIADFTGMEVTAAISVCTCGKSVKENAEALGKAYETGKSLIVR